MLWTSFFLSLSLSLGLTNAAALHKCPQSKHAHARPNLHQVKSSFHKAKIVPDLLPVFKPSSLLYLTYESDSLKQYKDKDSGVVLPGRKFAKDATEKVPEISIEGPGWPGAYVLFLLDPDAPSHSNPKWSQVRHMFVGNLTIAGFSKRVPGSVVLANETSAVNAYMPPAPPAGSGPHRYVALLYAQPLDFDYSFLNISNRYEFNLKEFSKRSGLGTPLAGTFMIVKVKEDEDEYWVPMIKKAWSWWRHIAFKMLF